MALIEDRWTLSLLLYVNITTFQIDLEIPNNLLVLLRK